MKNLALLLIVLACVGLAAAQGTTVTYTDLSTSASFDGSGINIHATLSPKGAITLDTGSVSALMTNGGTFVSSPSSSNGAYFNYNCGTSSGSLWNVAGMLYVVSTAKQGSGTAVTYQLTMTFAGYDYSGRAVSGNTVQMFTVTQSPSGVVQVKVVGGTTNLTVD